MSDLVGNHIVGFPTRRLIYGTINSIIRAVYTISFVFVQWMLEIVHSSCFRVKLLKKSGSITNYTFLHRYLCA